MYMVRKRFMYWQIPSTTKVHIRLDNNEVVCFAPAKRVKKINKRGNFIVQRLLTEYSRHLRDRRVTLRP